MNRWKLLFACLICLTSLPAFASTTPDDTIVRLQIKLQTIEEMNAAGEITQQQAQTATNRLLKSTDIPYQDIMSQTGELSQTPTQELTALQKFAGLITFMNIVWVIAIGLVCVGSLILFGRFLRVVPSEFYEAAGYVGSLWLVFWGSSLEPGITEYVSFTGMALGCGVLGLSWTVHKHQAPTWIYFLICTLLLIIGALTTGNAMAGFSAMITLMAALGFSVLMDPLCYAIGFKDKSALARATSAGFVMLALFVGLRMIGKTVPGLQLFEDGALFMGAFVGYLGLLIASGHFYANQKSYAIMQVITIVAGVLALLLGSVFAIPELQKIGGTFFVLYLAEKFIDIPLHGVVGYATSALMTGGFLWGSMWFLKSHVDLFAPYFFGL